MNQREKFESICKELGCELWRDDDGGYHQEETRIAAAVFIKAQPEIPPAVREAVRRRMQHQCYYFRETSDSKIIAEWLDEILGVNK
jgi:hypothetical protein